MPNRIFGHLGTLLRAAAAGVLAVTLLPASGSAQQAETRIDTEHFEIALVKNYTQVWIDSGTKAKRGVAIIRPHGPQDFYYTGDVAVNLDQLRTPFGPANYPYTIALKPKPGSEHLLAHATAMTEVWSTDGSKADHGIAILAPVCPKGFTGLGMQVRTLRTVSPRTYFPVVLKPTCISIDVLTRGVWSETSLWDDKGTGADKDISMWTAAFRGNAEVSSLTMPLNTFVASSTHEAPDQPAWVLQLPFTSANPLADVSPTAVKTALPTMTGPGSTLIPEGHLAVIEYQVPFYQVADPDLNFIEQWQQSPVYTIRRSSRYEEIETRDNTGNCETGEPLTFNYSTTVGTESSFSWNWNASFTASVEAKFAAAPLGVGGEVTVGASLTIGGGQERGSTNSRSTTVSDEVAVPAGTATALFKLTSDYKVYRQGSNVPVRMLWATSSNPTLVWAYYRLPGWNKDTLCPRSDVLLSGPSTLTKDRPYYSESESYYLLWDDQDFAVYTDSDNLIWSFEEVYGKPVSISAIAVSQDGQITLTLTSGAGPAEEYALIKNRNRPKGTAVYLTDDGALQVVAPNGRLVWDSTVQ